MSILVCAGNGCYLFFFDMEITPRRARAGDGLPVFGPEAPPRRMSFPVPSWGRRLTERKLAPERVLVIIGGNVSFSVSGRLGNVTGAQSRARGRGSNLILSAQGEASCRGSCVPR